jgi:chloramphenicol 3-O phosphotransferase
VPGCVVILNGPSSSGKSSIARQLLVDLSRPFFHMGIDMFGAMRSESRTKELDSPALDEVLRRTRAGFHRAVVGMALAGNDVIMDYVFSEPWRLDDCLDVMEDLDVVLVGVHCSLEELQRRERSRGDRQAGLAEKQFAVVHAHAIYDLEVDTSVDSTSACSVMIKELLEAPPVRRAFDVLRAKRDDTA